MLISGQQESWIATELQLQALIVHIEGNCLLHFYHMTQCVSTAFAVDQCPFVCPSVSLSVRLSVTLVDMYPDG